MKDPTEAELDALAIPWNGGEQPVSDETLVYVKLRGGWWPLLEPAENWTWYPYDIVAYVLASAIKDSEEKE